jgi:hypothetical protein
MIIPTVAITVTNPIVRNFAYTQIGNTYSSVILCHVLRYAVESGYCAVNL